MNGSATRLASDLKSSPEKVDSGSPPQNGSLQAEGGQQESDAWTHIFNSRATTALETARQPVDELNDRAGESEESEVQSEYSSEEVESCNSFGKSSIVYNEEEKVIFNRWQKLFQFRNIKETAKKSKTRNRRKRGDDDVVAMGQYFFPFTI